LALKIEFLKKFATFFKILAKLIISTLLAKMKLLKSIVYVIFQQILLGCREIGQRGGKILPKA